MFLKPAPDNSTIGFLNAIQIVTKKKNILVGWQNNNKFAWSSKYKMIITSTMLFQRTTDKKIAAKLYDNVDLACDPPYYLFYSSLPFYFDMRIACSCFSFLPQLKTIHRWQPSHEQALARSTLPSDGCENKNLNIKWSSSCEKCFSNDSSCRWVDCGCRCQNWLDSCSRWSLLCHDHW